MKKQMIAFLFFLPIASLAEEPPYSQGEFLSKLADDEATMKATPSMPNPSYLDQRAKLEKMIYPDFDRSMYNYFFYKEGKWIYTIMWDWKSKRCVFGIDKMIEDSKNGPVWDRKDFIKRHPNDSPDSVGETIKKSFCEKLYKLSL